MNISIANICVCCTDHQLEDRDHVLIRSNLAIYVWKKLGYIFNIRKHVSSFNSIFVLTIYWHRVLRRLSPLVPIFRGLVLVIF